LKGDGEVTLLGLDHLDALVALERDAQQKGWSQASLAEELSHPDAQVGGIFDDGKLVAHLILRRMAHEGWILQVAVHPRQRRRGFGGVLVSWAKVAVRDQGLEALLLEVRASNKAARGLYEMQGFAELATRRAYYPALTPDQSSEDAILMQWQPGSGD
jgi:ribosomal-protein-alanine N-acetyltransferase